MYNSNPWMPEPSSGPGYEHSDEQTGYNSATTELSYESSQEDLYGSDSGQDHDSHKDKDKDESKFEFDHTVEKESKTYQGQKSHQQEMKPKDDQTFFINQELMHKQEEKREHENQSPKSKKNSIEAMIDDAIKDVASR